MVVFFFNNSLQGVLNQFSATGWLEEDEEIDIILEMAKMPEMMEVTTRTLSPHHVARYLYTLTQKFSKFYHNVSISGADNEATKHTRLYMIVALRQVMMNCFNILGIAYIDEM